MSARTWWRMRRAAYYLAGVFFLVGVAGHLVGGMVHRTDAADWLVDALHGFGEALMVAALLGITVDEYLKRELVRDVGSIFVGWALPHQVRSYIREVSQTAVLRREYVAEYVLELFDEKEVKVTITIEFSVYNYGTEKKRYSVELLHDLIDRPFEDEITCTITVGDGDESYGASDLKRTCEGGAIKWVAKTMMLKPQDILEPTTAHSPACRVRWVSALRLRREDDSVITFATPALGVTIRARCPKGLVFRCDHSSGESTSDGRLVWSFPDRLFMSGQCIRVRWAPSPHGEAGQEGTAAPHS